MFYSRLKKVISYFRKGRSNEENIYPLPPSLHRIELTGSGKDYAERIAKPQIEKILGKEGLKDAEKEFNRLVQMNEDELTDLANQQWIKKHPEKAKEVSKFLSPGESD